MSISYPLKRETTSYGPLLTPYIQIEVNTVFGWRPYWFLIDTGAEFTVVPESLADWVGVNLSQCPKEYSVGIEGRPALAKVGTITLRLGRDVLPIRCHFLKGKRTPYLLGRMDLFTKFNLFFFNDRRRISFTRVD